LACKAPPRLDYGIRTPTFAREDGWVIRSAYYRGQAGPALHNERTGWKIECRNKEIPGNDKGKWQGQVRRVEGEFHPPPQDASGL